MKKLKILVILVLFIMRLHAEDGYRLWLRFDQVKNAALLQQYRAGLTSIHVVGESFTLKIASEELKNGLAGLLGKQINEQNDIGNGTIILAKASAQLAAIKASAVNFQYLGSEGFAIKTIRQDNKNIILVTGNTDLGILYGTYHLLRLLQTQRQIGSLSVSTSPKIRYRILNHWDNLNRTVERGYAGLSLWNWHTLPTYIDQRYIDYARANAQQTINPVSDSAKGLKDYYKDYFSIGVAVSPRALKTDEARLITTQFNSMTPENAMKMGPIHPRENEYFWKDADSIAAFARQNNLKLRGHTLCWHSQAPTWFFTDSSGKPVSRETLLKRLKDHITAVVSRYKGTVYAWDVVNEAISDKQDEYLRNSEFLKIIGEDYIAQAFRFAHEADPDALLFYNDYNEINPGKREKIYRLVKTLLDQGVPIHGIGLQGHWAINEPTASQLDSTLNRFAGLGLKLQVTELDISVYPKEHNAREKKSVDFDTTFTLSKENQQMEVYKRCFELFRKYKNVISGVTFWNISDRRSWLDNFPVRGRKDYPLLFDKALQPKKAYWEVVKF